VSPLPEGAVQPGRGATLQCVPGREVPAGHRQEVLLGKRGRRVREALQLVPCRQLQRRHLHGPGGGEEQVLRHAHRDKMLASYALRCCHACDPLIPHSLLQARCSPASSQTTASRARRGSSVWSGTSTQCACVAQVASMLRSSSRHAVENARRGFSSGNVVSPAHVTRASSASTAKDQQARAAPTATGVNIPT
jgi:hypothetical protein